MENKFLILIIVVVLAIGGISGFLLGHEDSGGNQNNTILNGSNINGNNNQSKNITVVNETVVNVTVINKTIINKTHPIHIHNNTTKGFAIAILSGPKKAFEKDKVQLTWTIKNHYNKKITNVVAYDEYKSHNFGTLEPGETKIYSHTIKLPSIQDVMDYIGKDDYPNHVDFYIPGLTVNYNVDGGKHTIHSNSIEIRLDVLYKDVNNDKNNNDSDNNEDTEYM